MRKNPSKIHNLYGDNEKRPPLIIIILINTPLHTHTDCTRPTKSTHYRKSLWTSRINFPQSWRNRKLSAAEHARGNNKFPTSPSIITLSKTLLKISKRANKLIFNDAFFFPGTFQGKIHNAFTRVLSSILQDCLRNATSGSGVVKLSWSLSMTLKSSPAINFYCLRKIRRFIPEPHLPDRPSLLWRERRKFNGKTCIVV